MTAGRRCPTTPRSCSTSTARSFIGPGMIEIRLPRLADTAPCTELAATAIRAGRAGPLIKSHPERPPLILAEADGAVVGLLAYRTDWFQCTFVSLVVVHEEWRRRGIAREFFKSVEAVSL